MFLSLLHVNVVDDPDRLQLGRQWLQNVYRVHQRLWMSFPDAARREEDPFFLGAWDGPAIPTPKRRNAGFLFRIEHDGPPRILVQSAQRPDWEYAFQNAPYLLAGDPQVRQFDPIPHRDQAYRFRLLANVVNRKSFVHPDGRTRTTGAGLTIARRRRAEILVHPDPIPDPLPVDPVERQRILLARWNPWRKWLSDTCDRYGCRILDQRASPLQMEAIPTCVRRPEKGRGDSNGDKPTDWRYNAGLFNGVLVCIDPERMRNALIEGIGRAKAFGFGLLSVAPVR